MKLTINTQRSQQLFRYFCWVGVILLLVVKTVGIFSEGMLAGWDTQGHYYLAVEVLEQLKQGNLSFYDESWFAGYPAFPLYGPLKRKMNVLQGIFLWYKHKHGQ